MHKIITSWLRDNDYDSVWNKMQQFTHLRTEYTQDQIWLLQHDPVYTMGRAAKPEHILNRNNIPLVYTDRGGQVTYHGPGQLMVYCLFDLRRYHIFVREYVQLLEDVVIQFLQENDIPAQRLGGAPGVYVPNKASGLMPYLKIASLGIKVSNGCAYHGLAINVDMDLSPFSDINPCGLNNVGVTDMNSLGVSLTVSQVGEIISNRLINAMNDYKKTKLGDSANEQ